MQNSFWLYARPDGLGVSLKIGHSGHGHAVERAARVRALHDMEA